MIDMENPLNCWQRLAAFARRNVIAPLIGRTGRLLCALTLVAGLALPSSLMAQSTTGSISGRVLNAGSGKYLTNTRVTVRGTEIQAFTDEYGAYRLNGVPAGEAQVEFFYSGIAPQTVAIAVAAGQAVTHDVSLGAASPDDAVVLDTFSVKARRETNIAAIATNEQRFAPNIKTVIETDAFGDIAEGNVGEFLKFLPGVSVDYVAADVRTVSVRGFGAQYSSVSVDGFRMASASSGSSSRTFEFEQVSINNAARIEVSKVPTPSMPADALGGAVNLISKNSFEREGAQLNYRVYLNTNSEDALETSKSPGPGRKKSFKTLPGFDFDYTLPVSKNLGFVITGLSSNQFNEQHRTENAWVFNQYGATVANPMLRNYVMQDGPKNSYRDSISAKMDWRISDNSSMWVGYQFNYYKSFFGNRNISWDTGSNSAPNPSSGVARTWGEDFTEGATGRGSVRHNGSFRDKLGATNALLAKYRYNANGWEIDAGAGASASRTWYRDGGRGHFSGVRTTLNGVSRVAFSDLDEERPGVIRALNAAGQEIDYNLIGNYTVNEGRITPVDADDQFRNLHLNVKRELDLPFRASLKAGVDFRQQLRDIRRWDTSWRFNGADGIFGSGDENAGAYHDDKYGVYSAWGHDNIQWPNWYSLWDLFESNPNSFTQTADQARNAERFRIQNSYEMEETVTSAYLQADARFLQNRLNITTGVRFERTEDDGRGSFTPTVGRTLAEVQATWVERGLAVNESYDGFYPSLHVSYNITDNLIARAAYASTMGRPDFANVLPLVRVNPDATEGDDGDGVLPARSIEYNNTALKPWEADNFDLSLEYYFKNGGLISVGAFRKDIEGFFGSITRSATLEDLDRLGLDPSYVGFDITTTINADDSSRISGVEMNFRQPLDFIPGIGQHLDFFFNATKINLAGSQADFNGFIEETANTGITFRRKPLTLRLNANYRGRQIRAAQTGSAYGAANGFQEYYADRVTIDVNGEYEFSKRIKVFANVRNLFNVAQDLERYSDVSPDYTRLFRREKFGAQITVGMKGTW